MEIRLANTEGKESRPQLILYSTLEPLKYVRVEIEGKSVTVNKLALMRAIEALS